MQKQIISVKCSRCGRELTDPQSQAKEIGPECEMTEAQQFGYLTNLTLAMATGYYDVVASRFFQEKTLIEAALLRAKTEGNFLKVKNLRKKLKRVNGILLSRELRRLQREQLEGYKRSLKYSDCAS